jgi:uncharacterized protein with FMN-binding domain
MPKRGVIAIVLTTGALVLLLSFKTPTAPVPGGVADGAAAIATGRNPAAAIASPTTTEAPTANIAPNPSAAVDAGRAPVAAAPTATPMPTPAATDIPSTAASDGTLVGQPVSMRWGTVQVQVTVSGGRITDISALQLPDGDPRSSQISQYAEPYLRESALQAQSAAVDVVSGATYTSQAYARSLQSALDQASGQG